MLFNSIHFLLFFPTVCFIYFAIPHRFRWIILLAASYYFYMCWKVEYIFLILITTLVNYFAAIRMERVNQKDDKKKYLWLCIFTNMSLLFVFKYFGFFSSSINEIFRNFNVFYSFPVYQLLLPVGISFYTFQSLSYTIDVYYGDKKAETHLGIFALYVSFFPQLVAGPIERSSKLIPQFYQKMCFDYDRVTDGLRLMGWGFFKKVVIADRLAIIVDQIYNHPSDYTGFPLILGTYFFAFQIYCDFSGYTDIAIGSARVMGFDLSRNFAYPYFSKNIMDFWRRWHMTLMSWFRDYIYIPMGGNRVSWVRWCKNIGFVFLVSGLWHGANWTFVIWGGIHGVYVIVTKTLQNLLRRMPLISTDGFNKKIISLIKIFVTFNMVTFAWIFFRANSLKDALYIINNILNFKNFSSNIWSFLHDSKVFTGLNLYELVIAVNLIFFLIGVEFLNYRYNAVDKLLKKPIIIRWAYYYAVTYLIIIFGQFSKTSFIYFQF